MKLRGWAGFVVAASIATSQGGCYKATLKDANVPREALTEQETRWESYFLWGLVGSPEEDTREICGGATPAMVRQDAGAGEWFVGFITLGIYSPRRLVVSCAPVAVPGRVVVGGVR
jgi:hypothetical protein